MYEKVLIQNKFILAHFSKSWSWYDFEHYSFHVDILRKNKYLIALN